MNAKRGKEKMESKKQEIDLLIFENQGFNNDQMRQI